MKKVLKIAGVSLALALCGSAHALTFNEGQNTHFTQYFTITPVTTNQLILGVFGLTSQFTNLSFDFSSIAGLAQSITLLPGTLNPPSQISVAFNDILNKFETGAAANFSLSGGVSYLLTVSGDTVASIVDGEGTVNLTVLNATIAPVPEPETYAILLAGLVALGAIFRRRKGMSKV
jgi:hypothetical protein